MTDSRALARGTAGFLACAFLVLASFAVGAADDGPRSFDIAPQALASALAEFARQSGQELLFAPEIVDDKQTSGVRGTLQPLAALAQLLRESGLSFRRTPGGAILIGSAPDGSSAPGEGSSQPSGDTAGQSPAAGEETQSSASRLLDPLADRIGEVIVTGTYISGLRNSASPLITLGREEIRRSGYATLEQVIESLPQNLGGGASQDTIGTGSSVGNNGFGTSINLRGLGPGSSLVLLNGRRLAPGGNSGQFIDISMIPMAAVERVDVLTDGASAIYGSDAVGGVVNFVLRENYEGAETSVRYGIVTDGDLSETPLSQSLGGNWNGGGALVAYEFYEREALDARDRDFASSSASPRTLLPEQERHSLYANVHQDIGERLSLFTDVLYSTREARNLNAFLGRTVAETSENEQLLGTVGADIALAGSWEMRLSTTYSDYQFEASRREAMVSTGAQTLSASSVDTDVLSVDALLNGAAFTMPGGDLRLAAGGSFRKENVRTIFDDGLPERDVKALFGEIYVPFFGEPNARAGMQALELTLAARYEDYDDFGSDVTPKVGLRWAPAPSWSLRATYGESFKAPSLRELATGTESLVAFVASDFGLVVPGDPVILMRTQAGRPELEQEESTSWTAGIDFQPAGSRGRVSVTYFDIEFEGRIDSPTAGGLESFFGEPDVFGDFMVIDPDAGFVSERLALANSFIDLTGGAFTPDNVGIWGDVSLTNIAAENQNGVDLLASYPFALGSGTLGLAMNATYILDFAKRFAPAAEPRETLNLLNEQIDLRLRGSASWSMANLMAALHVNYQDSYRNTDPAGSKIPAWTTLDATLRYEFGVGQGALEGLQLGLSIQNLLDKDPPFVASQGSPIAHPGYDAVNATPLGRFVALELVKSW